MTILVTHALPVFDINFLTPFIIEDFLSVRKIPVKDHGRLCEHGVVASSSDEPEAQMVSTYLSTIRTHLLQDRALHDLVCPLAFFVISYSLSNPRYVGNEGLCLIHSGLQ